MTIREYFNEFKREDGQARLETTIYGQYLLVLDVAFGYAEVRIFDGKKSKVVALLPANFPETVLTSIVSSYEKGLEDGRDLLEENIPDGHRRRNEDN